MSNIEELFPDMEASFKEDNGTDYSFFDYNRIRPVDIGGDEYYQGKPVLGEVSEQTFNNDDGTETKRIRCSLWLVDDDAEEYLEINLNPKAVGDIQTNIHHKSMLYKLIAGVMETIQRGWSQDHNYINRFNLSNIRDYLSKKESMTILLREESFVNGNGEEVVFYPFKVTEIV